MPVHGAAEFKRELQATADAIPAATRDLAAYASAEGLDDLITISPVVSGAFRASHAFWAGEAGPGDVLWEGPDRQPDDLVMNLGFGMNLPAPSAGEALGVLLDADPFDRWWLRNGRYYASWLEDGTNTMAPRQYYAITADRISRAVARRGLKVPGAR